MTVLLNELPLRTRQVNGQAVNQQPECPGCTNVRELSIENQVLRAQKVVLENEMKRLQSIIDSARRQCSYAIHQMPYSRVAAPVAQGAAVSGPCQETFVKQTLAETEMVKYREQLLECQKHVRQSIIDFERVKHAVELSKSPTPTGAWPPLQAKVVSPAEGEQDKTIKHLRLDNERLRVERDALNYLVSSNNLEQIKHDEEIAEKDTALCQLRRKNGMLETEVANLKACQRFESLLKSNGIKHNAGSLPPVKLPPQELAQQNLPLPVLDLCDKCVSDAFFNSPYDAKAYCDRWHKVKLNASQRVSCVSPTKIPDGIFSRKRNHNGNPVTPVRSIEKCDEVDPLMAAQVEAELQSEEEESGWEQVRW